MVKPYAQFCMFNHTKRKEVKMAEFLKKEDFNPGLRSKITQVNAAMQKLEDEIETVYLAGELDTTKKDEIKKRIDAFDKTLIGSEK